MGIIKRGILGGFSGKVAGVVGSSWKGIAVIKALPLSVANPRTTGQVAQRTKFSSITKLGSTLLAGIVKPLWDRAAQLKSGYNAFIQASIDAFSSAGVFIPANFFITIGKNAKQLIANVVALPAATTVTINWNSSVLEGQQLTTDEAFAVVYNETTGDVGFASQAAVRSDDEVDVEMNANLEVGDVISLYLAFRSEDGFRLFEQSVDLEKTIPA